MSRYLAALFISFGFAISASYGQQITPVPVASGLSSPLALAHAGDGSGRLFIVEQLGRIRILQNGSLLPAAFLDIDNQVGCCGERGLLGLAFHPQYGQNGFFYVNYTNNQFNTVIARFQVSANANVADPGSEQILLAVTQPFANHNGGHLAFGPDGYLYIGLGDGGSGGDPQNLAQNPQSLLGKMLRIDVDNGAPYAIPADNPFADDDFTLDEIWVLGLRNPFRYSFDRITGDLFIADVGQDALEEVHLQLANSPAGVNFGWRRMEGSQCFNPSSNCNDGSLTLPVFEYGHSLGRCSITGGYRYRGSLNNSLYGFYIYGDHCSGEIFGAVFDRDSGWSQSVLFDTAFDISSFGEDEAGELYVLDLSGTVYQLAAPLVIAPASGVYHNAQEIDLAFMVRNENPISSTFTILLDGVDVTQQFNTCATSRQLADGGLSYHCKDIPLELLTPGYHSLRVDFQSGTTGALSNSVQWEILEVVN